jgi:hypothetical protein
MVDYQPSLLAEFQIDHSSRGEVSITVGLGSPSAPIATKVFAESKTYSDTSMGCVFGGNHSFCANKIVLDISEFSAFSYSLYNQPFFKKGHDSGTSLTGNVTYFSINNYTCTAVPVATEQFENIYLTVNYTFASPTLTISPTSGPPSTQIILNGIGFNSGSSLVLSYLNPVTSTWTPIVNNLTVSSSTNFTYPFNVPDLMQANPSGDNPPVFDQIVFSAYDPAFGYSCNATVAFTEGRRGLTQLGTTNAAGLYGNNTDLTSTVFVQAGQSLVVAGQGFSLET